MFIAVVIREGGIVVPIVNGSEGREDCMATWETEEEALRVTGEMPFCQAFETVILEV